MPLRSQSHLRLSQLEKPQYKIVSINGANYRLLNIPAAWGSQAASESLDSHTEAPIHEQLQEERLGGESNPLDELIESEASELTDSEEPEAESERRMEDAQIQAEEEALDAAFLASCAAAMKEEEWQAEITLPLPLFQRVVRKAASKSPLKRLLVDLNVRSEKAEKQVPEKQEVVLSLLGPTERRVCLAIKKIREVMASLRATCRVTHFLSLPLATAELTSRFEVYKHLVLSSGYQTIDETLFIPKEKLHVTLLVLRLVTPQEVETAAATLKAASADIYDAVGTRTLRLHLKGNSSFSDDPSSAAVVYAPLYSSEGPEALGATKAMLNGLVGLLAERLESVGLLSREELQKQYALGPQGEIDCSFHMTLLNEAYRQKARKKAQRQQEQPQPQQEQPQQQQEARKRKWDRKSFDATQLLKDMKGFDFGVARVPSVQLNALGSTTEDGSYECLAHVDLP